MYGSHRFSEIKFLTPHKQNKNFVSLPAIKNETINFFYVMEKGWERSRKKLPNKIECSFFS